MFHGTILTSSSSSRRLFNEEEDDDDKTLVSRRIIFKFAFHSSIPRFVVSLLALDSSIHLLLPYSDSSLTSFKNTMYKGLHKEITHTKCTYRLHSTLHTDCGVPYITHKLTLNHYQFSSFLTFLFPFYFFLFWKEPVWLCR